MARVAGLESGFDQVDSVDRAQECQASPVVVHVAVGRRQSVLGPSLGFFGAIAVDLLRRFRRIRDDREYALLDTGDPTGEEVLGLGAVGSLDAGDTRFDREGGVGVAAADPYQTVVDGEHHLRGVAFPRDLLGIDDCDGNHLEASSAAFSTASSMVPT